MLLYVTVLTFVERIHLQKLSMPVSKRKAALVEELHKQGLDEFATLINSPGCKSHTDMDIYARRRDHISHVTLRSVVAFDAYKKRWFFKQEARLFKWRFSSLDNEGIRRFMQIYNFDFTPVGCALILYIKFDNCQTWNNKCSLLLSD